MPDDAAPDRLFSGTPRSPHAERCRIHPGGIPMKRCVRSEHRTPGRRTFVPWLRLAVVGSLTVIGLLTSATAAHAQTGTLAGRVTAAANAAPLGGVQIRLV